MNAKIIIACLAAIAVSATAHAAESSSDGIAGSALTAQLEAVAAKTHDAFSADVVQVAAERTQERAETEKLQNGNSAEKRVQVASLR